MLNRTNWAGARPQGTSLCRPEQGLSVVELLVGVAVGLFLVAGAATMFVSNLTNSRKLLVEARVNQDLRAAADLVARDLRRAGYWAAAIKGTIVVGTATAGASNPYQAIASAPSQITYNFSRDAKRATPVVENDSLDNDEYFGFQLNGGRVRMQTANGSWQDVTDPGVVTITSFAVTQANIPPIDIRGSCAKVCCDVVAGACTATNSPKCPEVQLRRYNIVITGQSVSDPSVVRTLRTEARTRNEFITGQCPA
jgi:prepilin peptidase dependent protein B